MELLNSTMYLPGSCKYGSSLGYENIGEVVGDNSICVLSSLVGSNETSIPMEMDGERVEFKDVNFDGDAAKQAENIKNYTEGLSEESSPVYRKSSSGLSGGAIAGIVIACVAVLIAAAVAAIMLRKPTPPIDNTTVVDLKQENI